MELRKFLLQIKSAPLFTPAFFFIESPFPLHWHSGTMGRHSHETWATIPVNEMGFSAQVGSKGGKMALTA